jgi:hypothetical protein
MDTFHQKIYILHWQILPCFYPLSPSLIYDHFFILKLFYKGIHKMMQLISNFLYKKTMFSFMQLHVY